MQLEILPLVIEPDSRLHIPSENVQEVNDEIRQLMQNMLHTMYHNEGIGLAAVQVGVFLRVVVIDVDKSENNPQELMHEGKPIFMVNPTIIERSSTMTSFCEGCLSLPTIRGDVQRHEWIVVEYLDYNGILQQRRCEGLLSICTQHEIDHTNGIIFIDHLSSLKKEFFMKKLIKLRKQLKV